MKYTRRIVLFCILCFGVLLFCVEEICTLTGIIPEQVAFTHVDPYRAIICAIIALLVGLIGFLWRHRKSR